MAKDKKKKKNKDGKSKSSSGTVSSLKALAQNPLIADVVAAALVATAASLRDSNKARKLAAEVGDELGALSKKGAQQGNAMWQLALDIGRQAIDSLGDSPKPSRKPAKARKAAKSPKKTKRTTARTKPN